MVRRARESQSGNAQRRAVVRTVLGAGVLMLSAATLIHADAATPGFLNSTSTTTASPTSSSVRESVTITTTVTGFRVLFLGIAPRGNVTFRASQGRRSAVLGTAVLGNCASFACTATLKVPLPAGTTRVAGTFNGNLLFRSSTGAAEVSVAGRASDRQTSRVSCGANEPCDSGTITSDDGTTDLRVLADAGEGNQSVSAQLIDGGTLNCPDGADEGAGSLAVFSNSDPDAAKTITYNAYGPAAAAIHDAYAAHTSYLGCFAAPHAFDGYIGGEFGPAQFVDADGLFEAQLNNCANNSGEKPCFVLVDGSALPSPYVTITISTLPGDPKFTPKP